MCVPMPRIVEKLDILKEACIQSWPKQLFMLEEFMDVYVGLLGSIIDNCVLQKISVYKQRQYKSLFNIQNGSHNGVFLWGIPCSIGWWSQDITEQFILEKLYNRWHKKAIYVVENSCCILKNIFWELFHKKELHVAFLLDMFVCYCILHNIVLGWGKLDKLSIWPIS